MTGRRYRRPTITRRILLTIYALLLLLLGSALFTGWLLYTDLRATVAANIDAGTLQDELGSLLVSRLRRLWPIFAGFLLVIGLLTWTLTRRLARRLDQLQIGMQALSRGEFGAQLPPSKGELGSLVSSFNNMSSELLRVHQDLQVRNSTLSEHVQQLESQIQQLQELATTLDREFRAEQIRRQLAEAIYHVSQKLSLTLTPDELPELLLEQLARVIPYDRGALLMLEGRQIQVMAARGWPSPPGRAVTSGNQLVAQVLRDAQPVLIGDAQDDPRYTPPAGSSHTRSWLGAPLLRQGKVIGALILESEATDRYGAEEQRAAAALAGQAAIAIENTRLYSETQQRMGYLRVVNEMMLSITTSQDWHGLLNTIIQQIRRLVPCDRASIALYHSEQDAFILETVYDARGNDAWQGAMLPAENTPWQMAYNAGQPVYHSDLTRSAFPRDKELAEMGLQSSVVVPIQGEVGKLGTLNLSSRTPAAFSSDQIRLLVELAPYLASALNNLRLRRTQSELSTAREQISESQRLFTETEKLRTISQLASGVAHDFNNLLAGILGNAQLLLLDEQDQEQRVLLKVIEKAARDGAETVRRLQTYTRKEQPAPMSEARMDLLVGDALDLTRPRWRDLAQARGITIKVVRDLQPVTPIAGRPAELREVLTNLIINAVDAMPEGGTLTARVFGEALAGDPPSQVVVTISDTGTGMTADVQARIFEPFFTTKGSNGTGLGLPVSRGIVESHGGKLEVESEPGQGTTFLLRLPLGTATAAAVNGDLPTQELLPGRILVVEDEPVVRDALTRTLRAWGHQVVEAGGGPAGIAAFAPGSFDLVITDLGMPEQDGWEVLRVVKQDDPQVATLLLTGWGNEIDRDEASARGADQLIAKPFSQDDLRRALGVALGN